MRIKPAIRTLETAARRFGGTVEDDSGGGYVNLQVCAPTGKEWASNGAEHIVVATARGPQTWLDDAVRMALEDIAHGVQDAPEEL